MESKPVGSSFPHLKPDVSESYDHAYYEPRETGVDKVNWASYAEGYSVVAKEIDLVMQACPDIFTPGAKVLDVGCAYGHSVARMVERGLDARGVDISEYAIGRGKQTYPGIADLLSVGSATGVKGPVDVITAFEFFEHIPYDDLPAVMDAFSKAAKWGIFVIELRLSVHERFEFNTDDTTQTGLHKTWWVDFLSKYGDIDWWKVHEFTRLSMPLEPGLSWGCRFFVVEFNKD